MSIPIRPESLFKPMYSKLGCLISSGDSLILNAHICLRWHSQGDPIAYTSNENIDYGTEYETVSVTQYTPYEDLLFLVIVSKGTLHNDASTTPKITEKEIVPIHNGLPQPLSYYVHPFRRLGGSLTTKVNGVVRSLSSIQKALTNLFTFDSSVNNIVSLYVTDYIGRYVNYRYETRRLILTVKRLKM